MFRPAGKVVIAVGLAVLLFVAGNLSGLYFYPTIFVASDERIEDEMHDDHEEEEHEHVGLTYQAFQNLGLSLGHVERSDYWSSLSIPGEVIEIPGKSDVFVSAPVSGVVEKVMVLEGQALEPNEPLFTLRITDDQLVSAQSELLKTLSRQEVIQAEFNRLSPLATAGTVAGSRVRDLQYELNQLDSTLVTLKQEIRSWGLPETMLVEMIEKKSLANRLVVSVPTQLEMLETQTAQPVSLRNNSTKRDFSIEQLHVYPGKSVKRGDDLCDLAFHAELYVRGQAFETDVQALRNVAEKGWDINVEIGHDHERHSDFVSLDGLQLLHVDNHVDPETQTLRFYLPIKNEVEMFTTDSLGRTFQQWRMRPGQRVHIRIPTEHWTDKIVLPLDAVVVDGPNAFVFVQHIEDHTHVPGEESDPEHIFIEFEPLPVRLLHRDNRNAVIEFPNQVIPEERIALDNAYKLHLAMKVQASGGGHHHHDH